MIINQKKIFLIFLMRYKKVKLKYLVQDQSAVFFEQQGKIYFFSRDLS